MIKKKSRIIIHLKCINCLQINFDKNVSLKINKFKETSLNLIKKRKTFKLGTYTTIKNRLNTPKRLELRKFCCSCNKHTLHKELK